MPRHLGAESYELRQRHYKMLDGLEPGLLPFGRRWSQNHKVNVSHTVDDGHIAHTIDVLKPADHGPAP